MSVRIEPHEVLAHLNRLGFCNVTTDQLQEFIGDLKKLIKHDLKSSSISKSVPEPPRDLGNFGQNEETDDTRCTSEENTTDNICSASEKNSCAGHTQLNSTGKTHYTKGEKRYPRTRSAFIKPRNLQPSSQRRNDPVALYHKYQSLWQQQKIPGDNGHVELRWNVRERMLGGDPLPRQVPCGTSFQQIGRPDTISM